MVDTDSKATSKTDIADTLGETFCHNSSSFNYSESFRKIKTEQEKVKLNLKVTAHTWAIFFQKIDFFHFFIFCSTSYYKQNNAK